MKTRTIFRVAFVSILVFVIFGTYFWYLYFKNGAGSMFNGQKNLLLVNSGNIDYINAVVNDDDSRIPIYYFQVKNNKNTQEKYMITLEDVLPSEVNDGCNDAMLFKREELKYLLKRDNVIVAKGLLSDLTNNILDDSSINALGTNDYSIKVYLNEDTTNYLGKHYHFRINLVEK